MDRSLHSLRMGTSQYDFASRWKRAEAVIEHAQKLVASKLFWGSTRDARCCPWLRGWFCCGLSDLLSAVANETLAVAAPFVALLHLISDSLCRKQPCAYVLIVCVPVFRQGEEVDYFWAVSCYGRRAYRGGWGCDVMMMMRTGSSMTDAIFMYQTFDHTIKNHSSKQPLEKMRH